VHGNYACTAIATLRTCLESQVINEIVCELAPTPGNPRNSEGSFITLGDGRIVFAYTRFTGSGADDGTADIASIESDDDGKTWTEPTILVPNRGDQNTMSVSFLRLHDGRIAMWYLQKDRIGDFRHGNCRPWMSLSDDEGATWTEPELVSPIPGYYVQNNDRVIQLKSGRLIAPQSYHRMKTYDWETHHYDAASGFVLYFLSDDAGATWRESEQWWALPVASDSGMQEPGVLELADGRIMSWARTDTGCQWGLESNDGGETWTPPARTDFVGPCAPLSIKRIPSTGDLLAVWNDTSGRFDVPPAAKESWGRTPLASAISDDDGATWKHHRLLEDDPESGYCYTAIHFVDDRLVDDKGVLLGYCAGGKATGGILNLLRVRQIDLSWFYGKG
jgi:sialidase-1